MAGPDPRPPVGNILACSPPVASAHQFPLNRGCKRAVGQGGGGGDSVWSCPLIKSNKSFRKIILAHSEQHQFTSDLLQRKNRKKAYVPKPKWWVIHSHLVLTVCLCNDRGGGGYLIHLWVSLYHIIKLIAEGCVCLSHWTPEEIMVFLPWYRAILNWYNLRLLSNIYNTQTSEHISGKHSVLQSCPIKSTEC